jgi:hypothetical protein
MMARVQGYSNLLERLKEETVPVRVTVDLPNQVVETLKLLAKKRKTTATEILLHAISLEQQLDDELD